MRRAVGPGRDRGFLFFDLVCYPPLSPQGPSAPVPGRPGHSLGGPWALPGRSLDPVEGPAAPGSPQGDPKDPPGTPQGTPRTLPELPRTPQ